MERDLGNAMADGDQQREEPGIERRMGLATHIDVASHEDIGGVFGMQWLDLRVGGLGEVEDVVTLQCLVEERKAQCEDDKSD